MVPHAHRYGFKSILMYRTSLDHSKVPDAPSLGCAILAATGAGLFPDVSTAVEKMVQIDRLVEPNSEVHQQYQPFYENYKETYHSMKKLRMGLE